MLETVRFLQRTANDNNFSGTFVTWCTDNEVTELWKSIGYFYVPITKKNLITAATFENNCIKVL